MTRHRSRALVLIAFVATSISLLAQTPHEAPAGAPATGVLAPPSEPGPRLQVSGVVVAANGQPIANASIYAYQTDAEGYYGVKPASDSANPRLKLFLRSGPKGEWSFETIRPGSYPNSKAPGHIHFEVRARGFAAKIFEIVFEGDPFITPEMRSNPAFSVRKVMPTSPGTVSERIVLSR